MADPIIVHPTDPSVRIRLVPGYTIYAIDELGGVWTLREKRPGADYRQGGWVIGTEWRPMKTTYTRKGYGVVGFKLPGKKTVMHMVSRLVLLAFVGPPPEGCDDAAHWDGDPSNNRLPNLRWATHTENEADKLRHGRRICGERHPRAKLTEAVVASIRRQLESGARVIDLARKYQIDPKTVQDIKRRKIWKMVV